MSSEKYVSVKDLEIAFANNMQLFSAKNYQHINKLINNAKSMIAIDDIEGTISKYYYHKCTSTLINDIEVLINPQPEKHGGLTIEQWEQLSKHPFVTIMLTGSEATAMFLEDYQGEYDDGIELAPDPPNMTRTNLDLPDGIKIEATFNDGSKRVMTTPAKTIITILKHYRILGVIENE